VLAIFFSSSWLARMGKATYDTAAGANGPGAPGTSIHPVCYLRGAPKAQPGDPASLLNFAWAQAAGGRLRGADGARGQGTALIIAE
jgi:hypothetical protein